MASTDDKVPLEKGKERNMKALIVVDMQKDFIDGSLGSAEARAIVPKVVEKIHNWDGFVFATKDEHEEDYLETTEGKHLPVKHCIYGTEGWTFDVKVRDALLNVEDDKSEVVNKKTFGSLELANKCKKYDRIEIVGLCTDICVISNALLIKATCPEVEITVDASCCAGSTPERHKAALEVMKSCQINIVGEDMNMT